MQVSRPLMMAGLGLIVLGLALVGLIWANWSVAVAAAKLAGAAQAATAAVGVVNFLPSTSQKIRRLSACMRPAHTTTTL